jgi:5'-deoxynucleotidase YfbR-like HD superfamily hydrolase
MISGKVSIFKELYENPMRNLNNVTRYSGVFCMKPENDGYHTIDMMAMCMKIADLIEMDQEDVKDPILIDRKDLIYRCYLHDMDESLMGDISRNIKYYNNDIYNAISNVVDDLMSSTFSDKITNDIKCSKDRDNICGLIVKISDTLQSSMKIYEECRLGNFHFKKIIEENITFVRNLKEIISSSKFSDESYQSCRAISTLLEIVDEFDSKLGDEIKRLSNY